MAYRSLERLPSLPTLIPFSSSSLFSHFTVPASCLWGHKGTEKKRLTEGVDPGQPAGKTSKQLRREGAGLSDNGSKRVREEELGSGRQKGPGLVNVLKYSV